MNDANKNPQHYFTQGLALQKEGKPDEALSHYKKAVSLRPDYIDAHISIGEILKQQGSPDEIEKMYRQAIAAKPDYAEARYYLAGILERQEKPDEAIAQYTEAIAVKPGFAAAHYALGSLFKGQGRMDEAAAQYAEAIVAKPGFAVAHYSLGNLLQEQGKLDEAAGQYTETITLKPDMTDAYIRLGQVYNKQGRLNETVLLYERLLALQPDDAQRLTEFVYFANHACAWNKIGGYEARLLDKIRQKQDGIQPFTILTTAATAEDQLTCARAYTHNNKLPQQALFAHTPKKTDSRIKIGYLSSDYYNHAVAHLVAGLIEHHDRSRFTVTGYSYGLGDNDAMRRRLIKAFDSFVDLHNFSDHEAAQKIHDDGTDILIDLNGGLTGEARIGIAACRPAPVQVNYLGYPGTMGVGFIDYIIADRFIIPEDQEKFYSEKVVCLPDTYQPNDTRRQIAETAPTRQACGLPEHGFIFCCFNATYKITPRVFDIWMRLLQKIPGSVLWLLELNQSVRENIAREAEHRGIDARRIIFAPKAPPADHLARYRLAGLFLDTLPVNAHTTTSDALWAGLPVLTCAGSTFAARVAGSLLKAAGLPELITYSLENYESLALHLAQNPARLAEIRQKLEHTRLQMPLFNIEKFTRNIEKSHQTMWDIWQSGDSPRSFNVTGD